MRSNRTADARPHPLILAVFAGGIAILSACSSQSPSTAGAETDSVVAEIDGKPVTMAELEEKAAQQLAQLEAQKRKILETTLAQVVEDRLLEAEAKARGISAEELLETETSARAPVTDADVDAWYEENQARVRQPKEQVAPQIKQYLEQQRANQSRADLLASLREKASVRILMEPDRVEVEVAGATVKGAADAPVTLVEFSDFECPFCSRVNPALAQVMDTYGDKVRLAFRHFPLDMHPNAPKAAEASLCADDQGRFWDMHDKLFANQRALGVDALKRYAAELGLDAGPFDECLDSGRYADQVAQDMAAGQAAGVSGTPAIFVNGRMVSGAQPFEEFAKIIDDELQRLGES